MRIVSIEPSLCSSVGGNLRLSLFTWTWVEGNVPAITGSLNWASENHPRLYFKDYREELKHSLTPPLLPRLFHQLCGISACAMWVNEFLCNKRLQRKLPDRKFPLLRNGMWPRETKTCIEKGGCETVEKYTHFLHRYSTSTNAFSVRHRNARIQSYIHSFIQTPLAFKR